MKTFKVMFGGMSVASIMSDFREKIEQLQHLKDSKTQEITTLDSTRAILEQQIFDNRQEIDRAEHIQGKLREILES